jgi:hypothetical protein
MSDLVYAVKLSLFVFKKKEFVFELCRKSRKSVHLERKKTKRLCQHVLKKLLRSLPPEEPFKSPEWQTFFGTPVASQVNLEELCKGSADCLRLSTF